LEFIVEMAKFMELDEVSIFNYKDVIENAGLHGSFKAGK
jgi:hypothetical protein